MFKKLFGAKAKAVNTTETTLTTVAQLDESLKMLAKKEEIFLQKAADEVEKAKLFTREKNKLAAIRCLKRKRSYEQQAEQLSKYQMRVYDQIIMLESTKATTDTVAALRSGASAMKAMHKAMNIDNVDKTLDEINEQTDNLRQIQDALSAPLGAADFDEDELEAELEELEAAELEELLLQPAIPEAPVPVTEISYKPKPTPLKNTDEEDELAALQAQMAL